MNVLNEYQRHLLFEVAQNPLFLPFGVSVWIFVWIPFFPVHVAHAFLNEVNPVPILMCSLIGLN